MKEAGQRLLRLADKWLDRAKNTCAHREHRFVPEDDNDWYAIHAFMGALTETLSSTIMRPVSILYGQVEQLADSDVVTKEEKEIAARTKKEALTSMDEALVIMTIIAAHESLLRDNSEAKVTGGASGHMAKIRAIIIEGILEKEELDRRIKETVEGALSEFTSKFTEIINAKEDRQVKH